MHCLSYTSILAILTILLTACGGGGGGGGEESPIQNNPPTGNSTTSQAVNGSAVKGPLVGASVNAYALDPSRANLKGDLIATGETDDNALINNLNIDDNAGELFLLEFTGGTDITTNSSPLISALRTLITREQLNAGTPVYATPLSTFALELALKLAGDSPSTAVLISSLDDAIDITKRSFGLGENTGLLANIDLFTTSPILSATTNQTETNNYRLTIEVFAALVLGIQEAIIDNGTTPSTDEVLTALATDLIDGAIDGLDSNNLVINTFSNLGSDPIAIRTAILDILTQDPDTLFIPGTNTPIANLIDTLLPIEIQALGLNLTITDNETPDMLTVVPGNDTDGDRIIDIIDPAPANPENKTQGLSFSWSAPEIRVDFTPLPTDQIAGYRIHYYPEGAPESEESLYIDASETESINSNGQTLITSTNANIEPGTLMAGTYFFSIASVDINPLTPDSDKTDATPINISYIQ
jgi:hypothetical protein